ncbi:MAG TPA: phage tail protein [Crinalium sp.]|jgi:phage tail-like protein
MPNLIENFPEILTACRFYVKLELVGSPEPVDAYFMDCKGFKRTQEVIEICEVTPQPWGTTAKQGRVVRTKVPGNLKSNNITLRRGLTCSMTLWQWFDDVQKGNWATKRQDVSLTIYDQNGTPQARFICAGAWPTSYTLTDLSSASNDIEIEELELAFEEFTRDTP